jgi:hypothetical protein
MRDAGEPPRPPAEWASPFPVDQPVGRNKNSAATFKPIYDLEKGRLAGGVAGLRIGP